MEISNNGLKLIEQFEGFRADQYRDAVGVPTIGFGTTASVISPLPETCTVAEAQTWLRLYVDRDVEPALNEAIAGHPGLLDQNEYDALCSLGYNLGAGCFGPGWQIGADLRKGDRAAVSADFLRYVDAGGHVLQGLVNRREAERALFDTSEPKIVLSFHYELYRAGHERNTVRLYDELTHTKPLNRVRIAATRASLRLIARAIWVAAHAGHPTRPDWATNHRGYRYHWITQRAEGNIVKPS